jgi:hypothetical protein
MRKESKLIKEALEQNGFTNKVSQKTISFMDLTRGEKLFVFVHN